MDQLKYHSAASYVYTFQLFQHSNIWANQSPIDKIVWNDIGHECDDEVQNMPSWHLSIANGKPKAHEEKNVFALLHKLTVGVCPGLNEAFSSKLQAGKHKSNSNKSLLLLQTSRWYNMMIWWYEIHLKMKDPNWKSFSCARCARCAFFFNVDFCERW
jgi:hypothetical protein